MQFLSVRSPRVAWANTALYERDVRVGANIRVARRSVPRPASCTYMDRELRVPSSGVYYGNNGLCHDMGNNAGPQHSVCRYYRAI